MSRQPWYLLFVGVNGAGKSTLYHCKLWVHADMAQQIERVNANEILLEQGGDWREQADQIRAGREAIRRVRQYFSEQKSFNQETTLSGKTILHTMQEARRYGYRTHMLYVGVQSPEIAVERIAHRLETGGHSIDTSVVKQRWQRSQDNFLRAAPLCDETLLFDNTWEMKLVARLKCGKVSSVYPSNPAVTWHRTLLERL